jgi:hypothetical protein
VQEPIAAVVARALQAYGALAELGELMADEWQYVNDLVAVHGADLRALVAAGPDRVVGDAEVAAVDAAIDEIALITDPHRAIDWLSTFPQVVRLALAGGG